MATDKLLAEWFWVDRWNGSSAFLMCMEARGVYREMLSQAWRRGGSLPNDHAAIRRAIGATDSEWKRSWPLIKRFWRVQGGTLVNDTQLEVYAATTSLIKTRSRAGKAGNEKRWGSRKPVANSVANSVANTVANTVANASPPISDLRSPYVLLPSEEVVPPPPAEIAVKSRNKRPIFSGQRLTVFDWMVDLLTKLLGEYTEDFDLHQWFLDLDDKARRSDMVIPQRDGGAWLHDQTLAEAQRRGLPIAAVGITSSKLTMRMAAMVSKARTEAT